MTILILDDVGEIDEYLPVRGGQLVELRHVEAVGGVETVFGCLYAEYGTMEGDGDAGDDGDDGDAGDAGDDGDDGGGWDEGDG
ncbi:hypothetical protein K432DRAFT_400681 [Lepidopterella palustris CBS 459.81]|uniref:Uncharacterized protein n=1 Tax=Lepidopterella palustris CBS 459.81 TaxID=1314670 RepID=A0A8E2EJC4_9PEZI|nr:hypothetical protein K432DRAFT_400681 [Lepidopterella palustris CBS 459.81]